MPEISLPPGLDLSGLSNADIADALRLGMDEARRRMALSAPDRAALLIPLPADVMPRLLELWRLRATETGAADLGEYVGRVMTDHVEQWGPFLSWAEGDK